MAAAAFIRGGRFLLPVEPLCIGRWHQDTGTVLVGRQGSAQSSTEPCQH